MGHMYLDLAKVKGNGTLLDRARCAFKKHHDDPTDYVDAPLSYVILIALPAMIGFASLSMFTENSKLKSMYSVLGISTCLGPLAHKYAHQRNHEKDIPGIVRILQDIGFLITPSQHRKHHEIPDNFGNWGFFLNFANVVMHPFEEKMHAMWKSRQ